MYVYQSRSFSERLKCYLILMGVFLFLSLGHGIQLIAGLHLTFTEGVPIWVVMLGVLYAGINFSVILTHIYLGCRVTKFLFSKEYSSFSASNLSDNSKSDRNTIIITLVGQIIFLAIYFWYV